MKILKYLNKEEQEEQLLFNWAFIENKPIGFPNSFKIDAYSNIFYWAHLEAYETSEFPLHPHEGFEIMTFIFEGEVLHYDTAIKKYISLKKGDVQVIKAGSGISHSEKITKGTRLFQIWFDPDFSKTMNITASYKDYKSSKFKLIQNENVEKLYYIKEEGIIDSNVQGLQIIKYDFKSTNYNENIDDKYTYSFYILNGEILINNKLLKKDDFLLIENTKEIQCNIKNNAEVFVIKTPRDIDYNRFIDRYK